MKGFGKRILGSQNLAWRGWPYLFILLICFLTGVLGGFLLAFFSAPSVDLQNYLIDYFELAAERELGLSFLSVAWDCVRWPLLVMVLGFTAIGTAGVPAVFLIRGFLLAYTVASFGVLLGNRGVAVAAVLFAVTILLVLPILFVLGCESLRMSWQRLPNAAASGDMRFKPEIILPSCGVLAIAAALQWTIAPMMLSAVCARLF